MNIVFVSTFSIGGAAQGTENTYRAFLAAGHCATYLALGPKFPQGVIPLSAISRKQKSYDVNTLINYWRTLPDSEKMLQGASELFSDTKTGLFELNQKAITVLQDADIVNIHWNAGVLTSPSFINAIQNKKVVITIADIAPFTGGCHYHLSCRRFEKKCGICPCLSHPNENDISRQTLNIKKRIYNLLHPSIVTLSKWQADEARCSTLLGNLPITKIIYTYDLDKFHPVDHKTREVLRQRYGVQPDTLVILAGAHGVDNPRKNISMLLRALNIIQKIRPNVSFQLVLYGSGKAPKASFPVKHLGFVDNSKIWELYALADLFVHPALAEALGNTLCEAQCCGTPVMTFDVGGCPETYRPGYSGFCVTPATDDALIKALIGIFDDPEQLAPMRLEARKYAEETFSADKHIEDYMDVFRRHTEKALPLKDDPELKKILQDNIYESYKIFLPRSVGNQNIKDYNYSKISHFKDFHGLDKVLYGIQIDLKGSDLKKYQDLLVLAFISDNIPKGSRLLEVGGGKSRILAHLACEYECWNVDRFEGLGNGPRIAREAGYKVVLDYMGNNNPELKDDYFDFVFSISALEHTPNDPTLHARILEDMNRVLKPGGWSLHLFDVVFKPEGFWTNPLLPYLFENTSPLFPMPDPEAMRNDPDLYVMSKEAYDRGWKKITGKTYEEFGQPTSINILWRKGAKKVQTVSSKSLPRNNMITDTKSGPEVLIPAPLPTISIVTPSFNQGEFLEECIDSILSQGYPNLEYVIMDGGSTDGSVEIIKRYEKHLKYWQSRKDNGQYWAINEGFKHTFGEIMAWLNSDDKYHHGAFYKAAHVFSDRPDVEWIVGRPTAWNEDGSLSRIFKEIPLWDYQGYVCEWPKKMFIQQESVFWRRSLWNRSGAHVRADMQYAGDFELWIRFFRHAKLYSVDALLGGYRYQANQKVGQNSEGYKKYLVEAVGVAKKELKDNLSNVKSDSAIVNDYISLYPGRHVDHQRSINISIENTISVYTSLMPREINKQINAVNSWKKMGFNVVSINCQQEVGKLKVFFQDVEFVEAKRDGRQLFGKPLVYFDDILKTALERNDTIVGIINSDIILQSKLNIRQLLLSEAKGSLFYGRREDVEKIEDNFGELYHVGFDCFFFDRFAAKQYPKTDFCIGVPWWDYWAILMPLLHGVRIKCINRSGIRLLHVLHDTKWSIDSWLDCGNIMTNEIYEHISRTHRNQAADLLSKRFSSGFFHSLHSDCNNLFLETNFVRNAVNILGTNASPRIKTLRFFGTFILEFIHKHTHR